MSAIQFDCISPHPPIILLALGVPGAASPPGGGEGPPSGPPPAGPELDRRIREAVASWDAEALLTMDEGFRERAGDDAVASISFLMGALDGLRVRPRVLSYEGPFGVGYMVAAIDILEDEGGEAYAHAERAQADPIEPESLVAAAGAHR